MGRVREQAPGQVLPAHRGREAPAASRGREVAPHGRRHRGNPADDAGGSMTLWSRLRSWSGAIFRRSRRESDMDAELRFHLESYAEDLVRRGVPRAAAMRQARLDFGGIDRAKEECRDALRVTLAETLARDLPFGAPMLRQAPGF